MDRPVQELSTSPSGVDACMILLVGDNDMGPHVLGEVVRVCQTFTTAGTETSSFFSVLGKIVRSESDIHSNCEEHTLLVIVVENKPLDVVAQLFHVRTSKHVKSFTLWDGHESLHILVVSWIDW